jgi:zinc transporter
VTESQPKFLAAVLFDGSGGGKILNSTEVQAWTESDGVLWVDCDQNEEATQHWLEYESGVSSIVADILMAGETRPRTVVQPNGLAIIVRGINMNPGAVPDDMVAARVWLEKNRIITSHRRKMLSIDDLRDALMTGQGPRTVGEFLVSLADFLSDRIGAAIENIEDLVDSVELGVTSDDIGDLRTTLGGVRRQAAAIRRYLGPQRDALDRLTRADAGIMSDADLHDLREEEDRLTRHLEDLDLAREHALVTQEELMNRVAHEQNVRMYLLSVVAVIFLPLTFVTGLLGMNVAGLPGLENPNGFVYSVTIMAAFGIGLAVYFKLKKWI